MFKLDLLVEDKKLAKVLKALGGDVYNLQVRPVPNAKAVQGKVKEVDVSGGMDLTRQFILGKVGQKQKVFNSHELASQFSDQKIPYHNMSYALKEMVKHGVLSRRTRGEYAIHTSKFEKGSA